MAEGPRDEIDRSAEGHMIANPLPSMQGASNITQNRNESQMESLSSSVAAMQVSNTKPLPSGSSDIVPQASGNCKPSDISCQQANWQFLDKYQNIKTVQTLHTAPVFYITDGRNSNIGNAGESHNVMNSLKADSQKEDGGMLPSGNELHVRSLNRCLLTLVRDIDFKAVSMYIEMMELFDETTMRDISDQKTECDKTRELIKRLKLRDKNTYDKFKECLVQAKQEFLKDLLEKEEAKKDN